jgi:hypothetical protein
MCAWCKRIGGEEGDWWELEEALSEMELFNLEPLPSITHGVCTECQNLVMKELEEAS